MSFAEGGGPVLSASSIFTSSQLYFYQGGAPDGKSGSFSIGGASVPLYYLDDASLVKTLQILPKSEGIALRDGRVYMLFESASNRFLYGKAIGAQYVYSYGS